MHSPGVAGRAKAGRSPKGAKTVKHHQVNKEHELREQNRLAMLRKTKYKEGDFEPLFLPDNLKRMVEPGGEKKESQRSECSPETRKAKLKRTKSALELETEALQAQKISFSALKAHIKERHPRDKQGNKFGICAKTNTHRICRCEEQHKIVELTKEIGLGAGLFLMSTKSLGLLFLILTIINIPVFVFYSQASTGVMTNLAQAFATLSFGNLGRSAEVCEVINFAAEQTIELNCQVGVLTELKFVGISKSDDSARCQAISKQKESQKFKNFIEGCHQDNSNAFGQNQIFGEGKEEVFTTYYEENCFGKPNCTIPFLYDEMLAKLNEPSNAGNRRLQELGEVDSTSEPDVTNNSTEPASPDTTSANEIAPIETPTNGTEPGSNTTAPQEASNASASINETQTQPVEPVVIVSAPFEKEESSLFLPECFDLIRERSIHSNMISEELKAKYEDVRSDSHLNLPEPKIIALAECQVQKFSYSTGFQNYEFSVYYNKEDFAAMIIGTDMFCVLILIAFVAFLEKRQTEFVVNFQEQTIEMNDFSLVFKAIPPDDFYNGNEHILRAYLWQKIEEVMNDEYRYQTMDENRQIFFDKLQHLNIVDITFAKKTYKDVDILKRISTVWKQKQLLAEKIRKTERKFETQRMSCIDRMLLDRDQKKIQQLDAKYELLKGEYEVMFSKQKQADQNDEGEREDDQLLGKQSVIKAYVVFRSMKAKELVVDAYRVSWSYRMFIKTFRCCCHRAYNKIKIREINGVWPHPKTPELPDNIQWQNMGVSQWSINVRRAVSALVVFLFIILAFSSIMYLKGLKERLNNEFSTNVECPAEVTKAQAYWDHQSEQALRQGLMHCFCFTEFKKDPLGLDKIDFGDVGLLDGTKYCSEWLVSYGTQQALMIGSPMAIAFINIMVGKIIELIAYFQKLHTRNAETMVIFREMTILQYFNIAIVMLIVNFNIEVPLPFFDQLPILKGSYPEFTVHWYKDVGATLCLTMLINTMSPHGSKIMMPVIKCLMRWMDRGFKNQLSKQKNADDHTDEVNTRQVIQHDLETLYTGSEIATFFVYAQYFTSLWSVLTFSSGMPILYPIACLNYFILFWVYKILLTKHYQKTNSFNEELPQFSMFYFKMGVALHLIIAAFMFSNTSIVDGRKIQLVSHFEEFIASYELFNMEDHPLIFRFSQGVGLVYFAFILVLIIAYLCSVFSVQIIAILYFLICCGGCHGRKQQKVEAELRMQQMHHIGFDSVSNDILKDLRLSQLEKLYERAHMERTKLSEMDQDDFNSKVESNVQLYQYLLNKYDFRLHQIQITIRHHTDLLIYETGPKYESNLKKLQVLYKLQTLIANEKLLLSSQNPKRKQSFRMKGTNQSYYILNSAMYKDHYSTQKIVETEIRLKNGSSVSFRSRSMSPGNRLPSDLIGKEKEKILKSIKEVWLKDINHDKEDGSPIGLMAQYRPFKPIKFVNQTSSYGIYLEKGEEEQENSVAQLLKGDTMHEAPQINIAPVEDKNMANFKKNNVIMKSGITASDGETNIRISYDNNPGLMDVIEKREPSSHGNFEEDIERDSKASGLLPPIAVQNVEAFNESMLPDSINQRSQTEQERRANNFTGSGNFEHGDESLNDRTMTQLQQTIDAKGQITIVHDGDEQPRSANPPRRESWKEQQLNEGVEEHKSTNELELRDDLEDLPSRSAERVSGDLGHTTESKNNTAKVIDFHQISPGSPIVLSHQGTQESQLEIEVGRKKKPENDD